MKNHKMLKGLLLFNYKCIEKYFKITHQNVNHDLRVMNLCFFCISVLFFLFFPTIRMQRQ